MNNVEAECSFENWYPIFSKDSLDAVVLQLPFEVLKYLAHDKFVLPIEATTDIKSKNIEWSDGSSVSHDFSEVFRYKFIYIIYFLYSAHYVIVFIFWKYFNFVL